jgi:hypothetical protein
VVGGALHVPIDAREGRGAIKKILTIVEIEDGKMALRLLFIAGGKINHQVTLVAQKARAKFVVFTKLAGAHGTMVTSRSLASTCWP